MQNSVRSRFEDTHLLLPSCVGFLKQGSCWGSRPEPARYPVLSELRTLRTASRRVQPCRPLPVTFGHTCVGDMLCLVVSRPGGSRIGPSLQSLLTCSSAGAQGPEEPGGL